LEVYSIGVDNAEGIGQITSLSDFCIETTTKPSNYAFLNSLVNMEYLEIKTRHLTDVSFLNYMPNLLHLSISGAIDLTDISAIRSCPNMTELSLRSVTSLQDYSPIAALGDLDSLSIDECGLKDISFLSSLKNLIYVSLTYNEITDLSPLENLPLLSDVYVYGNSIENYGTLDRSILYE
jgi:internalin A